MISPSCVPEVFAETSISTAAVKTAGPVIVTSLLETFLVVILPPSCIAVPAFREIAQEIYLQEGLSWHVRDSVFLAKYEVSIENLLDTHYNQNLSQNIHKEYYPSVVGMHVTDAIQLLEARGHNIVIKGQYGVVKKQYPKAKTKIKEDLAITLFI